MKKRRKNKNCLNCGQSLHENHNYCSNCGQENTDNEIGIGLLIREFTSNFFSLDSRFGRTFKPFLFRPGKITNAFNTGKRVSFANPIRWYLVISIFHFFFFIRAIDPGETKGRAIVMNSDSVDLTEDEFDSLYYLPDSLHFTENWPLPRHYYTLIDEMNKDDKLNHSEIMDSLKLNDLPFMEKTAARQIIKINRESSASLTTYILRQIPAIMFFILPLYAFILKLFFWRKGIYIKHLIHSLHLHSFFFFILGIGWIALLIIGESVVNVIPPIAVLFGAFYILLSFKNVYNVKWLWTIFRFFLVGMVYFFLLTFSLVVGVLVSLVLF